MTEKITSISKERYAVWTLLSFAFLATAVYLYCVGMTTFNIIKTQDVGREINSLRSSLSVVESDYIAKRNSIDLAYAKSLGFEEVKDVKFISARGVVLSLNNEI